MHYFVGKLLPEERGSIPYLPTTAELLKFLEENTILRSPLTGYVTARNFDKDYCFSIIFNGLWEKS